MKNIGSGKDPARRIKIQAKNWEKIFVNHISSKGIASRIYKELSKFSNWKIKQIIHLENGFLKMKRHFTEEDIFVAAVVV